MAQWLADFFENRESRRRIQKLKKKEKKLLKDVRKLEKKNDSMKEQRAARIQILNDQKEKFICLNKKIQMTMQAEEEKMVFWTNKLYVFFMKDDKKESEEDKKIRQKMQDRFPTFTRAFDLSTATMASLTEELRNECSFEESAELRKKIVIGWRLQKSAYQAIFTYSKEIRAKELKEKIEKHENGAYSVEWNKFAAEFPEAVKPPPQANQHIFSSQYRSVL